MEQFFIFIGFYFIIFGMGRLSFEDGKELSDRDVESFFFLIAGSFFVALGIIIHLYKIT